MFDINSMLHIGKYRIWSTNMSMVDFVTARPPSSRKSIRNNSRAGGAVLLVYFRAEIKSTDEIDLFWATKLPCLVCRCSKLLPVPCSQGKPATSASAKLGEGSAQSARTLDWQLLEPFSA